MNGFDIRARLGPRSEAFARRLETLRSYLIWVPAFMLLGWALALLAQGIVSSAVYHLVPVFALTGAYAARRANVRRRGR